MEQRNGAMHKHTDGKWLYPLSQFENVSGCNANQEKRSAQISELFFGSFFG